MVGITLSQEQIRGAPPAVRRWLEQELAASLGLAVPIEAEAHRESPHLVALDPAAAEAVLSLVRGTPPLVNVFFELGRNTGRDLPNGLHVQGLLDMQNHTQLQSPQQVIRCLELLNRALRQVNGDADASFFGLDNRANCFIAQATHRSVRQLWERLLAEPAQEGTAESALPAPAPNGGGRPPAGH